jgi:hypothetical protein
MRAHLPQSGKRCYYSTLALAALAIDRGIRRDPRNFRHRSAFTTTVNKRVERRRGYCTTTRNIIDNAITKNVLHFIIRYALAASCQGGRQYVGLWHSWTTAGPRPRQLGGAESEKVPADSEHLVRNGEETPAGFSWPGVGRFPCRL